MDINFSNITNFAGYLAAECMELWWKLENDATVLHYSVSGGICCAAALTSYLLFRKCSREPESAETNLAKIHYYAGCTPEFNSTNACLDLLAMNPQFVNVPLWKQHGISHGYTPFLRACWNNNYELIHFMLKIGADIKIANADGETALYLVAYRVSKSSEWDSRALKLLWEAGCSVDAVNIHNNSMLHLAAKAGNTTLTRWLLLHGAEPDVCNSFGFTPLTLALKKGSPAHLAVANILRTPVTSGCSPQRKFSFEEKQMAVTLYRSVSSPVKAHSDECMTRTSD